MAEGEKIYEEFDQHIIPPSWKKRAWKLDDYKKFYRGTIGDESAVAQWWGEWAEKLAWFTKWDKVLDAQNPPFYRWFVGAETNLAYLCLDWQLEQGRKNKIALIWEGEPFDDALRTPRDVRKFTFYDLYRE